MCLCYLVSAKTAWQLVNRKADFLQNESIRITNGIDSNRELECSNRQTTSMYVAAGRISAVLAMGPDSEKQ